MKKKLITFSRIIKTGIVNFGRNAWLGIAAMAVMIITLTIVLFSLVTNATFTNTIAQITNKIDVSVFLQDSTTTKQADDLLAQLRQLPNVKSVAYLDKAAALKVYEEQNPGYKQQLQSAVGQLGRNPIPATILIKPKDLNKIQDIKDFLSTKEVAALQTKDSPSYNGNRKDAIDKIAHATTLMRRAGVGAVIIFTLISVLIIFNTIQMAIFNRRDELTIMRLLGASTWYIRGPFVVESIMYGVISAFVSILIIHALFVASSSALQATSLGLLDINYAQSYFNGHFLVLLTLQLVLGILIGAASSVIATQRYLKFKSK